MARVAQQVAQQVVEETTYCVALAPVTVMEIRFAVPGLLTVMLGTGLGVSLLAARSIREGVSRSTTSATHAGGENTQMSDVQQVSPFALHFKQITGTIGTRGYSRLLFRQRRVGQYGRKFTF